MPMLTAVIYKNVTLLWGTESKAFLNTFSNMPLQNIDIIIGHYYKCILTGGECSKFQIDIWRGDSVWKERGDPIVDESFQNFGSCY